MTTAGIDELVKRLQVNADAAYVGTDNLRAHCREAATAILAMSARIAELEGALKPFAEAVREVTTDYGIGWTTGGCNAPGIGDLRRAARALAETNQTIPSTGSKKVDDYLDEVMK